jgi:uncharacterized protein
MKYFLSLILVLFSFCVFAQIDKIVPAKPNPPRLVNDYTGTLLPEQVNELERKLVAYDDSTSNQVVIVMIPTLGDYVDQEVALKIIRDWGVGQQGKNNGVVILIAKDDRKIRIETGYGLEGAIPDVTARSIIENSIKPAFREGNYYRGLDRAVDDIMKAAAGEYKAPEGYNKRKGKGVPVGLIIFFIILFVIVAGAGGRGGGGMISRRGYGGFGAGWILGSLLGGGRGGSGWSGGGGGWSGGGGGGFGGFGGGSGGGGGASGSW